MTSKIEEVAQPDICVIGGGPAGLTASIALRLAGYSVVLLDARTPPIDKACGEGLMPDTLDALDALGVHIPVREGMPFRGVRFVRDRTAAQAEFGSRQALGVRRTVLHRVLVERASQLRVDLQWGSKGVRYTNRGIAAGDALIEPRLLTVGADGQHSAVRQAAGLHQTTRQSLRYGFRRHYSLAPWSPYVEVHWGAGCQIYVTPVSPREIGVALLTSDPRQRLNNALTLFPNLEARLKVAVPVSSEMGAITTMRTLQQVYRNTVALVGDASGSVDAITGEGIGLAVRQAAALAAALQSGHLESYERAHRRIQRIPRLMADSLLLLSRYGFLQKPAIAGLGKFPGLFDCLLAMHIGGHAQTFTADTGSVSVTRVQT